MQNSQKYEKIVGDAMTAMERDNNTLKHAAEELCMRRLDKQRVGELIDLVGTIGFGE